MEIHFDDYLFIHELKSGAQGKLFLIQNKQCGTYLVVKQIEKQRLFKENTQQHLKNEIEVLNVIQHPSIVEYITLKQDHNSIYFVMNYIEGVSLDVYLAKSVLSPDHALQYLFQIIIFLKYLHQKKVVFRDLKPSNLMIDKQGYLKLIDFGYSKIMKNNLTYTFCGTPHYMAPEIVSNKGHSFESDYWSLGIVLFEMLTGEVPFNYSDPSDIYQHIVNKEIKFPKKIDKHFKKIIQCLTTKNPEQRRLPNLDDKIFSKIDREGILNRTAITPYKPL